MSFTCKYCGTLQETSSASIDYGLLRLDVGDFHSKRDITNRSTSLGVEANVVRYAFDDCKNVSVFISIGTAYSSSQGTLIRGSLIARLNHPSSTGQPFPVAFQRSYSKTTRKLGRL